MASARRRGRGWPATRRGGPRSRGEACGLHACIGQLVEGFIGLVEVGGDEQDRPRQRAADRAGDEGGAGAPRAARRRGGRGRAAHRPCTAVSAARWVSRSMGLCGCGARVGGPTNGHMHRSRRAGPWDDGAMVAEGTPRETHSSVTLSRSRSMVREPMPSTRSSSFTLRNGPRDAIGDDALGHGGADSREQFKLRGGSGVEVDEPVEAGTGSSGCRSGVRCGTGRSNAQRGPRAGRGGQARRCRPHHADNRRAAKNHRRGELRGAGGPVASGLGAHALADGRECKCYIKKQGQASEPGCTASGSVSGEVLPRIAARISPSRQSAGRGRPSASISPWWCDSASAPGVAGSS